jgi:tetratricopeptide (TPR) repeat protein
MWIRSEFRAAAVAAAIGMIVCSVAAVLAQAQTPKFIAPPRTITDVTAILDQQKPDPARAAKLRADADAEVPGVKDNGALGRFYFHRAEARALVGRIRDAIADSEQAIALGGDSFREKDFYQRFLRNQYYALGDFKRGIEINQDLTRAYETSNRKAPLFALNMRSVDAYLFLGDLKQAEIYLEKSRTLLRGSKSWKDVDPYRTLWESSVEAPSANLLYRRGNTARPSWAFIRARCCCGMPSSNRYHGPISPWPTLWRRGLIR